MYNLQIYLGVELSIEPINKITLSTMSTQRSKKQDELGVTYIIIGVLGVSPAQSYFLAAIVLAS